MLYRFGYKFDFQLHAHTSGQSFQRTQGRIGVATLQFADVALRYPRTLRQLLLGQASPLARINHSLDDCMLRLKRLVFPAEFLILQLLRL